MLAMGALFAAGLMLAGATGRVTAQEGQGESPPCEWFEGLAEGYPELEIVECEGRWSDEPRWEGHGLLSWNGRTAVFVGSAWDYYAGPELEYVFWWPMGQATREVCGSVSQWLNKQREERQSWRDLPRYRATRCTVEGVALTEGEYTPAPTPGVFWVVKGVMHEQEGRGQAYYEATLHFDLDVESVSIFAMDYEPLVSYPGGKYMPLIPADPPAPGDTGTGLAPTPHGAVPIAVNVFAVLATALAVLGIVVGFRTRYRP